MTTPCSYLPKTAAALADLLRPRFGGAVTDAVLAELGIGLDRDACDEALFVRAIEMALDAELVLTGAAFPTAALFSALADAPKFRRAAQRAGLPAATLAAADRLRIDAACALVRREGAREGAAPLVGLPAEEPLTRVLTERAY